ASKQALQLLPERDPLQPIVSQQLQTCERLLKLAKRLPALLRGTDRPGSPPECLGLASMCQQHKQLYAAATRFYGQAFDTHSALADDLQAGHRYNAACAAALAGCGQGKDAPPG